MRVIFFIILLFFFSSKGYVGSSPLNGLKEGIQKIAPFHIVKNTAEKISSFGLDKLFWGFASLFIVTEAYEAGIFDDIDDIDDIKDESNKNSNLKKIISKGQIHTEGISDEEAKRRALDDALYFASIKGGVKVHGFSSIDNQTNITENFTVKPQSRILDYNILNSYKEDDIYIVEIEAIVGHISEKNICNKRKSITVKEFKGNKTIVTNLPQEIDKYIHILSNQISENLRRNEKINYISHKNEYYDLNSEGFDKSYDYLTLVNGNNSGKYGDFIYIPSLKIYKTIIYPKTFLLEDNKLPKIESYKVLDTDAIRVEVSIDIFNSVSNSLAGNIEEKYLIPINTDSNFEIIELFTKADREYIDKEFFNIAHDIYNLTQKKLFCQPLAARLQLVNDSLRVPLGTSHGLRKNQLAVIETDTNDWTMLSISNIGKNNSELRPLNSSVILKDLSGKRTRFLE